MRMKVAAVIIGSCLVACVAFAAFHGEQETVTITHTVKTGDTMWSICNKYYMENSDESFNEFFHRAVQENGAALKPGQTVTISNVVVK